MDAAEVGLIARVLRAPLGQFVAAREDAIAEARSAGDREAAERIAALRKPSLVLWALNQAGAVAGADLDALRDAAEHVRDEQERLLAGHDAAATMQEAARAQRRRVDTLCRRLAMVLSAAGHATADDTVRRINGALLAASNSDERVWAALRDGALTAEPALGSFPVIDVAAPERRVRAHTQREDEARRHRTEAERAVRAAEAHETAAREQVEAARLRLATATRELTEARARLAALRTADVDGGDGDDAVRGAQGED